MGPMGPVLNSSFLSMKQLGVLLFSPEWDGSPSKGYPQHICWYPFVHLGEEKHCESKVSCPRTQHNDHSQGSNPDHSIQSWAHWPWGHHASTLEGKLWDKLIRFPFVTPTLKGWGLFESTLGLATLSTSVN